MKKHSGPRVTMSTSAGETLPMSEPAAMHPSHAAPATRNLAGEMFEAVRRRWGVIAIVTLLTALAAWMLASMQPERYRASAIAAITAVADTPADQIRGVQALNQSTFVATVAALASTPAVSRSAMRPGENGYSVRAVVLPSTNLLRIEVDGGNAARAAEIANRVPPILSAQTRRIFQIYGVTPVSPAGAGELIFPRKERAIAAGLIVGLLLGTTVAWALTRSRTASTAAALSPGAQPY